MRYVLSGQVDAVIGQDSRESVAGAAVGLYQPVGKTPVVFHLLTDEEATARAPRLLASAVTDGHGRFQITLASDTLPYEGGLLEVGLRLASPPGRPELTATARSVECTVTTLTPVWQRDGDDLRTEWRYAVPRPAWARLRARLGAYVITGRLSGSDGASPIVGAHVHAFDVDPVQDDRLGTGTTDSDGWFRIDYKRAAFERTPNVLLEGPEQGTADVYFTAHFDGHRLLAENRVAGLQADRHNVGPAFSVRLRTDVAPVTITVDSPSPGRITNRPSQHVVGKVSESAHLTVNGQRIELTNSNRFSTRVTLTEGVNILSLVAVATRSGVRSERQVAVTLDTAAPASPDLTRISVTLDSDGMATVDGETGCVEPDVGVRVTNPRTGNSVEAIATNLGLFTCRLPAQPGDTVTVAALDTAGNPSAPVTLPVESPLPPDPAAVAPPLPATAVTGLGDATAFLYTGPNPIQTGVDPETIAPQRAAVLRGRVTDRGGGPLPGVTVRVLDHLEFGQTLSRADGEFDLVVNGGGQLVVTYAKDGFLPAQRPAQVPWQDYLRLSETTLLQADTAVTPIDLSSPNGMQVARGSAVTDQAGTRRATVFVPAGTQATMLLPDGSNQPLTTLNVRVTEYTVGDRGPSAMPGALPPNSAYTYAVEYTVDEAVAAGAIEVRFDRPVIAYLENFLGFPTGGAVPAGAYDRTTARWIPGDNGRVISVLAITSGLAELDMTGDNAAEDETALAAIGITEQERTHLAQLYPPGQQLWRVPLLHFTPWDLNWPYGLAEDATAPDQPRPLDQYVPDSCEQPGASTIDLHNQVIREHIPVAGTPFQLCYASDRVPGRKPTLTIPLSGPQVSASLLRIDLTVQMAGREIKRSFPAAPDQLHTVTFDGTDVYGRPLQGAQPVVVDVGYLYQAVYLPPEERGRAFGSYADGGNVVILGNRVRKEITLSQVWHGVLDCWTAPLAEGLGAWTLNVHHTYDPNSQILHRGDGTRRQTTSFGLIISTFAGAAETRGYGGDGGSASQALLDSPFGLATGADGSLYIADEENHRVRRVGPDGVITTFAGTGFSGHIGDGGPATQAHIDVPFGLAVGADGSLYIGDRGNQRVRRVAPDGIITTVAGTGLAGSSGDGGPATQAQLSQPVGVAVGADGSLYIADYVANRVRRIGPDGIITTIAGHDDPVDGGDGGPASRARLFSPAGLAVGPDGSLYIAEDQGSRVRRISTDGIIATVAGTGTAGFSGDGGPATQAQLRSPWDVAVAADGSIYITDLRDQRVRRVGTDGIITTIAGTGSPGTGGDGGPAAGAQLLSPRGVAVDPYGILYIAEQGSNRVRRVRSSVPGAFLTQFVPAEDGRELYFFDPAGRHLQTLDALTGAVAHRFDYDGQGRLTAIHDRDDDVTRIERTTDGIATAIVSQDSTRTELELSPAGYLARVTDPGQATTRLAYDTGGLLAGLTDPRGGSSTYDYDTVGRLTRDTDAAGHVIALARVEDTTGFSVTMLSPLLREQRHRVDATSLGGQRRVSRCCGQDETVIEIRADGSRAVTGPDGTVYSRQIGPDPRWGMRAPLPRESTITVPSGLTRRITVDRTASLADPLDLLSPVELVEQVSVDGHPSIARFNATARAYTITSPVGRSANVALDAAGRVASATIGQLLPVTVGYDPRGRLTSLTRGSGTDARVWLLRYTTQRLPSEIVDPLGRTTVLEHDTAGRPITITAPDGTAVGIGYDAAGNVLSVTPPGRPTHTFEYDAVGNMTTYRPPPIPSGAHATALTHDADRQLTQVTRPGGRITDLEYDEAGRLTRIRSGTETIDYSYVSGTRQLASATTSQGTSCAYEYDGPLLKRETWSGSVSGTVERSYDSGFLVVEQQVGGESPIQSVHDADGVLNAAGDMQVQHDQATGLRTGATLGGVVDTWQYNALLEPRSHDVRHDGTELYAVTYGRDLIGRVTSKQEIIAGTTHETVYTYDELNRLSSATVDGTTETYDYDSNGNRTNMTTNGTKLTATYDDQDRALTSADRTLAYGPEGELEQASTVAGDTTRYGYDSLGRLIRAELPDGTQVEYVLDAAGRRVARMVNGTRTSALLYAGKLRPIAELDVNNQIVTRFIYADFNGAPAYFIRAGLTYRVVADHLGSPRLIVNVATGGITQRLDYDAWGRVLRDTNPGFQPFGFAGGLYDPATGLVKHGAREYDSTLGRWITKDPLGLRAAETNVYLYCGNDPINRVDPTGLAQLACPPTHAGPPSEGWKPYHGPLAVFHCDYTGMLEDLKGRIPTIDDLQNECIYDESGTFVDKNHPFSGCRGTPNLYDSEAYPWDHTFHDPGGVACSGLPAFVESRKHDRTYPAVVGTAVGVSALALFWLSLNPVVLLEASVAIWILTRPNPACVE